jgi:hypothetical protein
VRALVVVDALKQRAFPVVRTPFRHHDPVAAFEVLALAYGMRVPQQLEFFGREETMAQSE